MIRENDLVLLDDSNQLALVVEVRDASLVLRVRLVGERTERLIGAEKIRLVWRPFEVQVV